MRVVLDPNVIISGAISPAGPPADVVRSWLEGAFGLVVSTRLLDELRRALSYPKLQSRISSEKAAALVHLLQDAAEFHDDPEEPPPVRASDPEDDYLIALASSVNAVIVSGDRHLLVLSDVIPVYAPAAFLGLLKARS